MANKNSIKKGCCSPATGAPSECRVEAVVSVDERGQMVLPKEMRDKADIHAGDKLAVVSWEQGGKVCCLALLKVEDLTGMVKSVLVPLIGEIINK